MEKSQAAHEDKKAMIGILDDPFIYATHHPHGRQKLWLVFTPRINSHCSTFVLVPIFPTRISLALKFSRLSSPKLSAKFYKVLLLSGQDIDRKTD